MSVRMQLGYTGWHKRRSGRGVVTNWTSTEFAELFASNFGVDPTEQAAAQFAASVSLVAAIEEAQSLNSTEIAQTLRNMTLQEFYGDISFYSHPEPQMNKMPSLVKMGQQAKRSSWLLCRVHRIG